MKPIYRILAVVICIVSFCCNPLFCQVDTDGYPVEVEDTPPVIYNLPQKKVTSISYSVSKEYVVGKIEMQEGATPTGGKSYTVPLAVSEEGGFSPNIALSYNSQASLGNAGYGWNISGVSVITACNRTVHYDGVAGPIDLSDTENTAFMLDGVRLVKRSQFDDGYPYVTVQGFIRVRKRFSNSRLVGFDVKYPDGRKAVFGIESALLSVQPTYPLVEMTDARGYKIYMDYALSGDVLFNPTDIYYGGTSRNDCIGHLRFSYETVADYPVTYISGVKLYCDKRLKSVGSYVKIGGTERLLREYLLTHGGSRGNLLTKIESGNGGKWLNPLTFDYGYDTSTGGDLQLASKKTLYSASKISDAVRLRGKFLEGKYNDGLLIYKKFSPFTEVKGKIDSDMPVDEKIVVSPGISVGHGTYELTAGHGLQAVIPFDYDGDGVDEILKINATSHKEGYNRTAVHFYVYGIRNGELKQLNYQMKEIPEYIKLDGNILIAPLLFLPGDFNGDGKLELIMTTCGFDNVAGMNRDASVFYHIDLLNYKSPILKQPFLVKLEEADRVFTADVNGDGKTDICQINDGETVFRTLSNDGTITELFRSDKLNYSSIKSSGNIFCNYFACDVNRDGNTDIIYPSEHNDVESETYTVPIWAPRYCPRCSARAPIQSQYYGCCVKCGTDLLSIYARPDYAECIKCGRTLECHSTTDMNGMSCPEHGSSPVTYKFEYPLRVRGDEWNICLSTGTDLIKETQKIGLKDDLSFTTMDVDNDGFSDIVAVSEDYLHIILNENGKFRVNENKISIEKYSAVIAANVYDRGISHVVTTYGNMAYCYSYSDDVGKHGLITSSSDSYGVISSNVYEYMTAGTVYEHAAVTESGEISLFAPVNLLKRHTKKLGGNTVIEDVEFVYQGARYNIRGKGFRGFNRIKSSDNLSGIRTVTDYEDLGIPSIIENRTSRVEYAYHNIGHENFVLTFCYTKDKLKGSVSKINRSCDDFGNILTETLKYDGLNFSRTSTNTFRNIDTSEKYHVGLPLLQTVAYTRNGDKWTDRTVIEYNDMGLPISETSYTGTDGTVKVSTTDRTYDGKGNVISETVSPYDSGTSTVRTIKYDSSGRYVLSSTDELGLTTSYADYDIFGNACRVTDFRKHTTVFEYDSFGRLIKETSPERIIKTNSLEWSWHGGRYILKETVTGQADKMTCFDELDRGIRKGNMRFDGSWQYVDTEYDNRGLLKRVSLPYKGDNASHWNTYEYDAFDRVTAFREASGRTTQTEYDGLSITEIKDGLEKVTVYDASGAVRSVTDPGGTIVYGIRADGQTKLITAPNEIYTEITYDEAGRRKSIADPSAGFRSSSYKYENGNLTVTETNPDGKSVKTVFDKFGRKIRIERPEFSTDFTYDDYGQLKSEISDNGTSKEYEYDSYGRVLILTERLPGDHYLTKEYTFDRGNLLSVCHYNGDLYHTVQYGYSNGTKSSVVVDDAIEVWRLVEENDLGLPVKVKTGGITRTYSYDSYGKPKSRKFGDLQSFSYVFDSETGNLISRSDDLRGIEEQFAYDELNRLVRWGDLGEAEYHSNGNAISRSGVGSFEYNQAPKVYQISKITPEKESKYRSRTLCISHTSFDRPSGIEELLVLKYGNSSKTGVVNSGDNPVVSIMNRNPRVDFIYNSDGNRVKMIVRKDGKPVANRIYIGGVYERDSISGESVLYVDGTAYTAPAVFVKKDGKSKLYFIGRDYLGSVTAVADTDGNLTAEYSYDAWGRMRDPETHDLYMPGNEPELMLGRGFTGHEWLPLFRVWNMNARLYDPIFGRFLSPDPYVQEPDMTQNFNRYVYCLNNPLKYTDDTGELFIIDDWLIGGIKGLFNGEGFLKSANRHAKNSFKIWRGLFSFDSNKNFWGKVGEFFSRFTYQIAQTAVGFVTAHAYNAIFNVLDVESLYGATAISTTKLTGSEAFTIGSFIVGSDRLKADANNPIFQHEYGHYIQSQRLGPAYLFKIGIPSLISAAKGNGHSYKSFERNANQLAFNYFNQHIDGFYQTEAEWKYNKIHRIEKGWNFASNPLLPYGEGPYVDYYKFKGDWISRLFQNLCLRSGSDGCKY